MNSLRIAKRSIVSIMKMTTMNNTKMQLIMMMKTIIILICTALKAAI